MTSLRNRAGLFASYHITNPKDILLHAQQVMPPYDYICDI